jgi:hypothetical protein
LSWTSAHADQVLICPGIGFVALQGNVDVSPSQSAAYFVAAVNHAGAIAVETARVSVEGDMRDLTPVSPLLSMMASPDTMLRGKAAHLEWTSSDATGLALLPTVGLVGGAGALDVFPTDTTEFTILGINDTGVVAKGGGTVRVYRWPATNSDLGVTPGAVPLRRPLGYSGLTLIQRVYAAAKTRPTSRRSGLACVRR